MPSPSLKYELEREQSSMLVDTRTSRSKFRSFVMDPPVAGLAVLSPAVLGFFFYSYIEAFALISLITFWVIRRIHRETGLPMRIPRSSGLLDPKDLDLKTGMPSQAGGIVYMGNDQDTKEEIWLTDTQARTHMLFMGTTGSGKTEYLISLIYNSLVHGSGLIYVDGKADNSLYGKIYSMARAMGREDDVVVINFQTGARDIYGAQANKLSNTMNPFAVGSSGMLSELIKGLMATGKSDIWSERAASFVEALIKPLVYLRDNKGLMLDVGVVRDYFNLDKLEELAWMKYKDDKAMQESGVLDGLKAYLQSLAGYKVSKYLQQESTVGEQHGYIEMQLTKAFGSLSDTYGYIMKTQMGEIDFVDVFLNRRILIVLLPALEKSPAELTNLGRIVVASIKATMAKGLGATLEGDWSKVIDSRPTTAPSPFTCVLDEYGYYAVEGFAVVPAQARSLGFSAVFAGQDLPAFEKASKEEAKSTLANTNTKLCGKLECTTTFDYFKNLAGQGYYTRVQRYEQDFGSLLSPKITLDDGVSIDRIDRVSSADLRGQSSGQWFLFFGNSIIRVKSFFANPKKVKKLRVNHFIKVARPSPDEVAAYLGGADYFKRAIESDAGIRGFMDRVSSPTDIADINDAMTHFQGCAPILMAGKVLAYGAQSEMQRRAALAAMGVWGGGMDDDDLDEEGGDEGGSVGLAPDHSVDLNNDIIMHALNIGMRSTAPVEAPVSSTALRDDGFSTEGGTDQPSSPAVVADTLWGQQRRDLSQDTAIDPSDLYSEDPSEEFTIPAEAFDGINDLSGASLPGNDTELGREDPAYDQSNLFGFEKGVLIGDGESEPVDHQAEPDPDFGVEEQLPGAPTMAFDPPLASDGLLNRDALESGLAQIETVLGSTETEAAYTSSVVASKLADTTRYLSHPTTKQINIREFEEVARSISASIAEMDK